MRWFLSELIIFFCRLTARGLGTWWQTIAGNNLHEQAVLFCGGDRVRVRVLWSLCHRVPPQAI